MAPEPVASPVSQAADHAAPDLSVVFHKLNNQLGIILANAELLESRLLEEAQRTRASLVVAGALEAITSIQELRRIVGVRTNDV